jgi:hypothetical protein
VRLLQDVAAMTGTIALLQVNSLSFNPKASNILGVGTAAGEVMIYDVANPRSPKQGFGDEAVATYAPKMRGGGSSEVLSFKYCLAHLRTCTLSTHAETLRGQVLGLLCGHQPE